MKKTLFKTNLINKLTISPSSGAALHKVCEQAYDLSRKLDIPVEIIHNDIRYKVSLDIEEIKSK